MYQYKKRRLCIQVEYFIAANKLNSNVYIFLLKYFPTSTFLIKNRYHRNNFEAKMVSFSIS